MEKMLNATQEKIIAAVKEGKVIAIVRGVYGETCLKLAEALYAGGVKMIEVTFDQSGNPQDTADTIRLLLEKMGDRFFVGAGTVTSPELVRIAAEAGAQYIISPDTDVEVIIETNRLGLVSMPGALTPSEIKTAYRAGAHFVKVFPASNLGAGYIKAVRAPLNNIPLLAVGGVNEDNASEFIKAGAVGLGIGGNLVNKKWIAAGEFDRITETAKKIVAAVNG